MKLAFVSVFFPLSEVSRVELFVDRIAGAVSEINSLKDAYNRGMRT